MPRALQGDGRHDNPERYGCLYVAEQARVGSGGAARALPGNVLVPACCAGRAPLALVTLELDGEAGWSTSTIRGCSPRAACARRRWRPRRRVATQPQALGHPCLRSGRHPLVVRLRGRVVRT